MLWQRLSTVPTDLEQLFQILLDAVDEVHRPWTIRCLSIALFMNVNLPAGTDLFSFAVISGYLGKTDLQGLGTGGRASFERVMRSLAETMSVVPVRTRGLLCITSRSRDYPTKTMFEVPDAPWTGAHFDLESWSSCSEIENWSSEEYLTRQWATSYAAHVGFVHRSLHDFLKDRQRIQAKTTLGSHQVNGSPRPKILDESAMIRMFFEALRVQLKWFPTTFSDASQERCPSLYEYFSTFRILQLNKKKPDCIVIDLLEETVKPVMSKLETLIGLDGAIATSSDLESLLLTCSQSEIWNYCRARIHARPHPRSKNWHWLARKLEE